MKKPRDRPATGEKGLAKSHTIPHGLGEPRCFQLGSCAGVAPVCIAVPCFARSFCVSSRHFHCRGHFGIDTDMAHDTIPLIRRFGAPFLSLPTLDLGFGHRGILDRLLRRHAGGSLSQIGEDRPWGSQFFKLTPSQTSHLPAIRRRSVSCPNHVMRAGCRVWRRR